MGTHTARVGAVEHKAQRALSACVLGILETLSFLSYKESDDNSSCFTGFLRWSNSTEPAECWSAAWSTQSLCLGPEPLFRSLWEQSAFSVQESNALQRNTEGEHLPTRAELKERGTCPPQALVSPGTTSRVWRHFWLSLLGVRTPWAPGGRRR